MLWIPAGIAIFVAITIVLAVSFRKVVEPNMVHIVQSRKATTSYGTGQKAGNVYYKWPSWLPVMGVVVSELPVSNFDLSLKEYEAYDKDRVPFVVDIVAFFQIVDTSLAAQRVENVTELHAQLTQIVQGAVRKVLASADIDTIMLERAQFGQQFTDEVADQLMAWGVKTVKSMELMDIRDGGDSKNVSNIMAKKTSVIDKESRTEVANNGRDAKKAEIEAKRAIDIAQQEAEEAVGKRTAEKIQAVGIANELAQQQIKDQQKGTKEKDMAVLRVNEVRTAEIEKDKKIVAAEQNRQTAVIIADGALQAKTKESEGIRLEGTARADAVKAMQLAPVTAQIALAKEIGSNAGYQQYLAMLEAIKAYMTVGTEQAQALQDADVKVIANAGSPTQGMTKVMDLFTSGGGTNLASMIEAFAQTPLGQAALLKLGIGDGAIQAEGAKKE